MVAMGSATMLCVSSGRRRLPPGQCAPPITGPRETGPSSGSLASSVESNTTVSW
jgi:hypothetical protein